MTVQEELASAAEFGAKAEELVLSKGEFTTGDRNTPLMAYWSLAFEFHKSILSLLRSQYYGAAFALVRPLLEATIRAHLVLFVSDGTLARITSDEYRTNFGTVGNEIDTAFGMDGVFENFLTGARDALHGYTHIGMHQLGRRFKGANLEPNYTEGEIIEVIRVSTSAAFMVNALVTKHFGFEQEWQQNNELFDSWGKH